MTGWKKAVKYAAMALAILMTVSIISGIVGTVASVTFMLGIDDGVGEMKTYEVRDSVTSLDVELGGASLTLKHGDSFSVESDIKNISVSGAGKTLSVKQKGVRWSVKKTVGTVVITLPSDTVFNNARISMGAGNLEIEALSAERIDLDFGAGKVLIKKLIATEYANIDGGAGKITIESGEIRRLDLDMGAGEFNLRARLEGRNTFDMGVGKANVTLLDGKDNYNFDIDKGIGEIRIDGDTVGSGRHGSGAVDVEIDGGIGEINIKFEEEKTEK